MPSAWEVTVARGARVGRPERLEASRLRWRAAPRAHRSPGPARPPAGRPCEQGSVMSVVRPAGRDHGEQGEEREAGADEERVAEGPRGGALQLGVEVALELGRGRHAPRGRGPPSRRRGAGRGPDPAARTARGRAPGRPRSCRPASAERRAPGTRSPPAPGTSASRRSAVNTGVRIASPTTTPTWRAPMVHPACRTRGRRISIAWEVSRSTVSPSPRPTSAWGAMVQTRSADGRIARPTSPPAMRKQPTATSTSAGGRRRRASGRAARAATGTTDTVSAAVAGERRQPSTRSRTSRNNAAVSAADSRARVRLGRTAGRCRSGVSSGAARTASAAGTASTANGTCTTKIACHEIASREQPARDRSGGRADHAGRDPGRDAAALAVLRDQELQAPDQRQRASERLHAPRRDQHLDRVRQRAPRRGAGEHRDADGTEEPRLRPGEAHGRRHGGQPQHEVERDQHPGDLPDGGVQVPEDVGQRERDHRGVREHQRHGHREQRGHGTTHPAILA